MAMLLFISSIALTILRIVDLNPLYLFIRSFSFSARDVVIEKLKRALKAKKVLHL